MDAPALHPCCQKIFDDQDLVNYEFFWILCKWKVLLQTYRHSYTLQRCVITMGKYTKMSKNLPHLQTVN